MEKDGPQRTTVEEERIPLIEGGNPRFEARPGEVAHAVETRTERHIDIARAVLEHDVVENRRVAKHEVVDKPPSVHEEGNVTVVPVVEARLFVEKRLVLGKKSRSSALAKPRNTRSPWNSCGSGRKDLG